MLWASRSDALGQLWVSMEDVIFRYFQYVAWETLRELIEHAMHFLFHIYAIPGLLEMDSPVAYVTQCVSVKHHCNASNACITFSVLIYATGLVIQRLQ